MGTRRASFAMPAFPGAQKISSTAPIVLSRSFATMECSRPPFPTTRIFMRYPLWSVQKPGLVNPGGSFAGGGPGVYLSYGQTRRLARFLGRLPRRRPHLNLGIEPIRDSRTTFKDTRLIEITFRNSNPDLAAFVANSIAQDYLPRIIQIVVTANNANSATYSVGYNLGL